MTITIELPKLPGATRPYPRFHIALYKNVKNAAFLHSQVTAGNREFDYSFVDASMIVSTAHVFFALQRALHAYMNNNLRTRGVHSELIYALSPNNNISKAYSTFGITAASTDLIIIKVMTGGNITAGYADSFLKKHVQGEEVSGINDETMRGIASANKVLAGYKIPEWRKADLRGDKLTRDYQGEVERKIIELLAAKAAS